MAGRIQDPDKIGRVFDSIAKTEEQLRSRGAGVNHLLDTDGFGTWRICREHIRLGEMGAAAYAMNLWAALGPQSVCDAPLLHDIATNCKRTAPWLWSRLVDAMRPDERQRLEGLLTDAGFQHEAREKLWSEVGVTIAGKARGNGAAGDSFDDVREETAA
jgi:hypothetical protein